MNSLLRFAPYLSHAKGFGRSVYLFEKKEIILLNYTFIGSEIQW